MGWSIMPSSFVVQRLSPLAGLLALLACATTPRVDVDRMPGADLTRYETFALAPETNAGNDPAYGPTAREAARTALVGELRARGLELIADPERADALVAVRIATHTRLEGGEEPTPDDVYVERQRTGVRTPVGDVPLGEERNVVHRRGLDDLSTREVLTRAVVVDFFDADSKQLVWSGTSREPRSREEIDLEDLRERVRAIASQFP
jgi:uncharacterized protein DUF4136